jgi:hypothetical protein
MKVTIGEAPNSLTRRAMAKVYPPLYRGARNMDVEAFKRHIMDFEAKRGNPKTFEDASEIFRMLQVLSHGKGPGEAYILRDPLTGLWRGAETPTIKESAGLATYGKRKERFEKSFRYRYEKVTARSREDFISLIEQTEKCPRDRAEQIFVTMATNKSLVKPILYDKPTNTWRGHLAPVPSIEDFASGPPTTKQAYYWKLFHEMPWLNHSQRNLEESEAIPWVMQAAEAQRDEARKIIDRAWNCSKDKQKVPLQSRTLDGVKQIGGKGYVEPFQLTEEAREKLLNMRAVINELVADEKANERMDAEVDRAIMGATGCAKSQTWDVEDQAVEEGLLVKVEIGVNGKDRDVICGKKWFDELKADHRAKQLVKEAEAQRKQQEAEAQRNQQERLEEIDREMDQLHKRLDLLTGELRKMPKLTEGDAIKWIEDNQADRLGGLDPRTVFIYAEKVHKTIKPVDSEYYQGIDCVEPLKPEPVSKIKSRPYVDHEFEQEARERAEMAREFALRDDL